MAPQDAAALRALAQVWLEAEHITHVIRLMPNSSKHTSAEALDTFVAFGAAVQRQQSEVCLCAAILMEDGYIFRGHRHDDCYLTMGGYEKYTKADGHKATQGFLTSQGRFVTRAEAAVLHGDSGITLLFSENLY